MSSLTVTREQYRTHLEPSFGPRFLENVRDMNDRKFYRTCRLVCRGWARQFPVTDPERGKLWLREGVMWYSVEGDWRVLPSTYWAWTFRDMEWWAEQCCPILPCCRKMGCDGKGWYPKVRNVDSGGYMELMRDVQLIQPVDQSIWLWLSGRSGSIPNEQWTKGHPAVVGNGRVRQQLRAPTVSLSSSISANVHATKILVVIV